MDLKKNLCKKLSYEFNNPELLNEALTHRSFSSVNNERLEFLGDSILNFVVSAEIFRNRPDFPEGMLTRLRANLVCGPTLADIAREYELGDILNLGSGELKSGGFERSSILADTVEAIIGAVYIDGGFDVASDVIKTLYGSRLTELPESEPAKDPKTSLQELLQARRISLPTYELLDTTGKAHARVFLVACDVPDLDLRVQAEGSSIRKAEQAAASDLLSQVTAKV